MKKRVLLVDNDRDFLDTRADRLVREGYQVYKAYSYEEAIEVFEQTWIHVALIDTRLRDDTDDKDTSGLRLAKERAYRAIPKIIMTRYPTYQDVRQVLAPTVGGLPPAVAFIAKQEGIPAMLEAIETAFTTHLCLNDSLLVQRYPHHHNRVTFPQLVSLIVPDLPIAYLAERATEIEDLFRRLFYAHTQISLERLLWQSDEQVALSLFAFSDGKAPESLVVVCEKQYNQLESQDEQISHKELSTTLFTSTETLHFVAHAYRLVGASLDKIQSLSDLYTAAPSRLVRKTLGTLFQQELVAWHQGHREVAEEEHLDLIYRQLLPALALSPSAFQERLTTIVRQMPILGAKSTLDDQQFHYERDGRPFRYPNPLPLLYQSIKNEPSLVMVPSPGSLTGQNILTDGEGNIWLTNFTDAKLVPQLWPYVTLEAAIRFDWLPHTTLSLSHQMEERLVDSPTFSEIDSQDIAATIRRALRTIQEVRQLAKPLVQHDRTAYYWALFFQIANRLATLKLTIQATPNELVRQAHLLLAFMMIGERLLSQHRQTGTIKQASEPEVVVDIVNHQVTVRGRTITLRGQGYHLLAHLYTHANQLCSRAELIENALGDPYDPQDSYQDNRLNMAIKRLREKIEPDPAEPTLLLTVPGAGYRLAIE